MHSLNSSQGQSWTVSFTTNPPSVFPGFSLVQQGSIIFKYPSFFLCYIQAVTLGPKRWEVNLWKLWSSAQTPTASSRPCSVLSPCQSWRPTGPRYSGWIWNESGHFIAFSLERPGDLVLLEKNRKLSGELDLDSLNFGLWAAFRLVAVLGAALALGCVSFLCAVLQLFAMQHVHRHQCRQFK